DRDFQIFRVALDRLAERASELEAAPRRGNRELQHPHRERDDRSGPAVLVRPEERHRREKSVIEAFRLKIRKIELIGDQPCGNVPCKGGVALDRWKLARPATLVRRPVAVTDPECEMRVVIEEERS